MQKSVINCVSVCLLTLMATAAIAEQEVFARYARYGADVWAKNPLALISGEGKACISCHTSLPYALVEPLLPGDYPAYDDLIANINDRIRSWDQNTAWYTDDKLAESEVLGGLPPNTLNQFLDAPGSRGVEAIFNAFIRAMHDAYAAEPAQTETRTAFANLWSEQIKTGPAAGKWGWIEANLIPWEASDSDIWGASLACVAASVFPDLAPEENLALLDEVLRTAAGDSSVSLHTKAAVLWCDAESGGRILKGNSATELVEELLALKRDDGGWSLRDLGPWTGWEGSAADCCARRTVRSDAYATGFVVLALLRYRHLIADDMVGRIDNAIAWIERELALPYPAGPSYNTHMTSDKEVPEFRDNLYTNAGAMWGYLASWVHARQLAPWDQD